MNIKVAVPTDDGETISRHFGQAKFFKIITLENDRVISSEMRQKATHQHGDYSQTGEMHPGQKMVEDLAGCQVLISGGMGEPVLNRAAAAGLEVFLTRNTSIAAAVQAYLAGTLDNNPALVHMRHGDHGDHESHNGE
jgi:predicted Fe-Mo cluster-binding NifX family protein